MRWFSLGTFLLFSLACGGMLDQKLPVQSADKAVLLDADDVLVEYPSLKIDPTLGTYSKKQMSDGGIEAIYAYQTPAGQQPALAIQSHVIVSPDEQSAIVAYGAASLTLTYEDGKSKLGHEDRPDALAWGDDHRCTAMLTSSGQERGVTCLARKGRRMLLVAVAGSIDSTPLSHDHGMNGLMGNRLKALETYSP